MTTAENLYKIADEQGINIYEFKFDDIISMSAPLNIAIDKSKIDNAIELIDVLSHELGHCITNSFYNKDNILDVFEKQEHKANMWKLKQLLPLEEYIKAIAHGITDVKFLACEYDLRYDFAEMAAEYYNNNFDIEKLVDEYKAGLKNEDSF